MRHDLNRPPATVEDALERQYPRACAVPCRDCPWRRGAARGWLGPMTGEEWIDAAHGEGAIACHLTIPAGGGWGDATQQCAGAAAFRANVCKQPRNPTIAVGPERDDVFASDAEFLEHHRRRP
jgi:hypothetical protein